MSRHCHNCDEEVMPIDGDCPLCGHDTRYFAPDATLTLIGEDGQRTEIGQVESVSWSIKGNAEAMEE